MTHHPSIRIASLSAATLAAVTLAVSSPAALAGPEPAPSHEPHAAPVAFVGSVVSIDPIRTRPKGTGVGAVAGGVVGGVLGHEIVGGTLGTVAGAAGGAVVGNNLERNHREGVAGYHVHVRLDDGRSRTITETHIGDLRVGDRVRIEGGRVHRI